MNLFEIISFEHLDTRKNEKYGAIASNGRDLIVLDRVRSRVVQLGSDGEPQKEWDTVRPYTGLCYDPEECCYWGCCARNSGTLYRLDKSFQELDRVACPGYQKEYGYVKSVTWDRGDQNLIVTYSHRIVRVDRKTFCEKEVLFCDCATAYQCCVCAGECRYCVSRECNTDHLTAFSGCRLLVRSCLPEGYRVLGMTESCEGIGPVLNILAVKHGTYYYLLKGILVNAKTDCAPCCTARGDDCGETGEEVCGCCKKRGEAGTGCCGGESCGPLPDEEECGLCIADSCAALIQSIALEQTAISHILNAEGEKIQKVVAESCRTADMLAVNQSVLEMVTKLTHLEQVLFSKLEITCNSLHKIP